MTKSTFNVDAFLGTEYKEANDTHLIPLERGEYQIQCLDLKGKKIEAKETGDEFTLVEVFWHVLGEEAKNKTGLEKPLAKQTLFLELT
ncbi:MAG: hypothetical protein ACRDF4_04120, partial [Rhabdochlamydiaceae bacterium]